MNLQMSDSLREKLGEKDERRVDLILKVLENLSEKPLVLKGGTALMLFYGLDRLSEDLDFNCSYPISIKSVVGKLQHIGNVGPGIRKGRGDVFKEFFLQPFLGIVSFKLTGYAEDPFDFLPGQFFETIGFTDYKTKETKDNVTCEDYGHSKEDKNCAIMWYYPSSDDITNCVIGYTPSHEDLTKFPNAK